MQVTLNSIGTLKKVNEGQNDKATTNRGQMGERTGGRTNIIKKSTKNLCPNGSDDKISCQSKRTKSDDKGSALGGEQPNGAVVNFEAMKESLRKKGAGTVKPKGSKKKDKKTAMFAEATSKGALGKPEPEVKYNKCVVAFAIRVNKGTDTKVDFDKKIVDALSFLQTYINKYATFFSIDKLDSSRPPIKEKADIPAFQVILRRYFDIPNKRVFDSVNQDGGRAIKGSAVMGFSLDPQKCLEEAAGDLRHMGCSISYKQCQEVSMVTQQILLGGPNTIKEDITKQTLDKELKLIEQKLLLENNTEYKLPQRRQSKWLNYAVVWEFPAGMPWEGAEEKKQK
jgi:hypothetical protein